MGRRRLISFAGSRPDPSGIRSHLPHSAEWANPPQCFKNPANRRAPEGEFSGRPPRFFPALNDFQAEKSPVWDSNAQYGIRSAGMSIPEVTFSASPVSAPNAGARSVPDRQALPADSEGFGHSEQLCKPMNSFDFVEQIGGFHLSRKSTHPSAKELVFFVSRLGVTTMNERSSVSGEVCHD